MTINTPLIIKINDIEKTLSSGEALALCHQLDIGNSLHFMAVAKQVLSSQQLLKQDRLSLYQLIFNYTLKHNHYNALLSFSQQAIATQPSWEVSYYALALAYRYLRQPEQAKTSLIKALKLCPKNILWRRLLGRMHQEFGEFLAAKKQFDTCISLNQFDVESYWLRSDIDPMLNQQATSLLSHWVSTYSTETSDQKVTNEQLAFACMTLFRHFDATNDSDLAYHYLSQGNQMLDVSNPCDMEKEIQEHKAIQHVFSTHLLAHNNTQCLGNRSLFICGLPRSGTTLVEQILSSHSEINAGDELFYLAQASQTYLNEKHIRQPFPEWANRLKKEDWYAIGKHYLRQCQHLAQGNWLTDKMPLNYKAIGVINNALPAAKIIYCRRNREDTIWGCYKQILGKGNSFSHNLVHLQQMFQAHEELMLYWQRHLSHKIFILNYEALVANQDAVTKELCQFIGVNYQANMHTFYHNKHAVHTVSNTQVRNAINTGHIGGWKKYQNKLHQL